METPRNGLSPPYPNGLWSMYPPVPPSAASTQPASANVSPLVIALIGILVSAFLLVSYYTVIAKYCTNWETFRDRVRGGRENQSHSQQAPPIEAWALVTRGLDESLIKSIPVCKYRKGDGLVEGTECAVCLSEFQEDESLRLLPKCTHAFHLPCIDMWLSSHSNCPLCRANIVSPAANSPVEAQITVSGEDTESSAEFPLQNPLASNAERENVPSNEESEEGMVSQASALPSAAGLCALGDSATKHARNGSLSQSGKPFFPAGMQQPIRRSSSMDSSRRLCVSITDLLAMHPGLQDDKSKGFPNGDEAGSSASSSFRPSPAATEHQLGVEMSSKVLNKHLSIDKSKSTMRRTFSGGKFVFFKNSRGRNAPILPT